jgi:sodium-independent sulfate anion transporter 11
MSLEVGKVIHHVKEVTGDTYSNADIATALAFISGIICLGIGLLRCGFILEFIPGKSISCLLLHEKSLTFSQLPLWLVS